MINYVDNSEFTNYVIDVDNGTIKNIKTNKIIGCCDNDDYQQVTINRKTYYVHRLVYSNAKKGMIGSGMDIDHINGDKTDNRIENLREITHEMNMMRVIKDIANKSHQNRRRVKCIDENGQETIYPSQNACGRAIGVNAGVINMLINGKCQQTKGKDGKYYKVEDLGLNSNNFGSMDKILRQCIISTKNRISRTITKDNKNKFIQACIDDINGRCKFNPKEKDIMVEYLRNSI